MRGKPANASARAVFGAGEALRAFWLADGARPSRRSLLYGCCTASDRPAYATVQLLLYWPLLHGFGCTVFTYLGRCTMAGFCTAIACPAAAYSFTAGCPPAEVGAWLPWLSRRSLC